MHLAEPARHKVNRIVWGVSAAVVVVVPTLAWVGGSNAGPVTCISPPPSTFMSTTVPLSPTSAAVGDTTPPPPDTGPASSTTSTLGLADTTPPPPDTGPASSTTSTLGVADTTPLPPDTGPPAVAAFAAAVTPSPNVVSSSTTTVPSTVPVNCPNAIERVSVDNSGLRVTQTSSIGNGRVSISADGRYVAFYSYDLLTPGATGGPNVYVRDRVAQTTTLVSDNAAPSGQERNSMLIGMSADGRFVVFASNEVFDPSGTYDVYRRDMLTGATARVTPRDSSGVQSFPPSSAWFLSASGRYLAFSSPGTWWNGGVGTMAVALEDLDTLTTELVAQSDLYNYVNPSVSDDGRYVAYSNNESANNVIVDRVSHGDVFTAPSGGGISVSPDGTKAMYTSRSNGTTQVTVADIPTGNTLFSTNVPVNGFASSGFTDGAWSPDSQRVAFISNVPIDGIGVVGVNQVFVREVASGITFAAPAPGPAPDNISDSPALANGSTVAFASRAENLVPDDGSGAGGPPNTLPGATGSDREDIYVQGAPPQTQVMPAVGVHGVVSSGGVPVAGVRVIVNSRLGSATLTRQSLTGASGDYSAAALANSTVDVFVSRTLPDGSEEWAFADGASAGGQDLVKDIPIPQTVDTKFVVHGVGGGVIPGAEVHFQPGTFQFGTLPDGSAVRYEWAGPSPSCVTGADGSCTVRALAGFVLATQASYTAPGGASFTAVSSSAQEIIAPLTEFDIDIPFAGSVPSSGSVTGSVVVAAPEGMSISNVSVQTVLPDVLPTDAVSLTGAVSYQVDGVPSGGTADVVLVLPPGSNPTAVYKVLGGVAQDVTSIATISGDTIVVHLTDGGLGDGDGLANGVIVDPIVPVRTQATTSTAVVVAPSVLYGEPVTVTASVTPGFGSSTAEGAVDVVDGAAVVCAAVPLVNGVASCTVPLLAGGSHTLSARFAGSTYFLPSASSGAVLVVSPAAATVVLTAPASATSGSPVPLSATVMGVPSGETPGGSVSFSASNGSSCAAALVNGVAGCSLASLPAGTASVVAHYGGDANYAATNSDAASITVVAPPTTVTLSSSLPSTVTGQSTLLRAAVTVPGGGLPSGTVRFLDGGRLVGSAPLVAGTASLRVSFVAGDHQLTAVYIDLAGTVRGQSSEVTQHVQRAATATVALALPLVGRAGKPTTIAAAVVVRSPGAGVPIGQVRFREGTAVLGTATLSSGVAVLDGVAFTRAVHTITVEYLGSADFLASMSTFQYVVR